MQLTRDQQNAVDIRGRNILVSAAAGSGKTATLTKRIIGLLCDRENPADISDMLIVTFTREAAGELRSRITDALSKEYYKDTSNEHLARQLALVGSARISTIDSYYLNVVRENFQRLDLPSSFGVASPEEDRTLCADILHSVTEAAFRKSTDFARLAENLTTEKGDAGLEEILHNLTVKLLNLPEGISYLDRLAELYEKEADTGFAGSRARKAATEEIYGILTDCISRAQACLEVISHTDGLDSYVPRFEYDLAHAKGILDLLSSSDTTGAAEKCLSYSAPDKMRAKGAPKAVSEEIRRERDRISEGFGRITYYLTTDDESFSRDARDLALFCRTLSEVLNTYVRSCTDEKLNRQLLSFSDLRRYALRLLVGEDGTPTDIAVSERSRYSHIFVDEYQDTDPVQDLIFRTISNGQNLFIVGDIKQSIYSFRGAAPDLFSSYRSSYREYDSESPDITAPAAIYMSENFRCAKNIIAFTNLVCSFAFTASESDGRAPDGTQFPVRGIGYRSEDDLVFSRSTELPPVPVAIKYCADAEADYIISEITRLHKEEGVPYGDIAVLTRWNADALKISDRISGAGIPCSNSGGTVLFENPEVLLLYSVMSAVDNPRRDIPLAAALKSPVFGFTVTDLVCIRHGRTDMPLYDSVEKYASEEDPDSPLTAKCRAALEKLAYWRTQAAGVPIDRFIRFLWRETDAMCYAGSDPESVRQTPEDRRHNLRLLYDFALKFQSSGFRTLHDFVAYVADILSLNTSVSTETPVLPGSVRVMTVHKSKGLEFPVVFLYMADRDFSIKPYTETLLFTPSDDLGIGMKLCDSTGFSRNDNSPRLAISARIRELNAEDEIRILYVALTRARDRLYITCGCSEYDAEVRKVRADITRRCLSRYSVLSCKNWLDWILAAAASPAAAGIFTEEFISSDDSAESSEDLSPRAADEAAGSTENAVETAVLSPEETAAVQEIYDRMTAVYSGRILSQTPAKLSVSRLYPDAVTPGDEDPHTEERRIRQRRIPSFAGAVPGGAEKGTATHLFLQFCDFAALDGTEDAVLREAQRLTERGFISAQTASLLRVREIAGFSSSSFFCSLSSASGVHRETRFSIFLPASGFTTDAARREALDGEKILVQGVIDLFYTDKDGKLVLCDYKTDRFTPSELKSVEAVASKMSAVHGEQLRYYALSVEQLTGRYPDRICVFPLQYGEAVDISL